MRSSSAALSVIVFTECHNVAGLFVSHKHCTVPVLFTVYSECVNYIA